MSHSTYTNLSVRYLPKDYYHHTVSVSHFTHQCFVSDELISREAVMKFHHVHLLRGETGLSVNFLCSLHGHVVPHQPCTNINAQPWCNTWIFQCKQRIIMAYGGSQISQENRLKVNSLSGSSKDVHTSVVNVIPIISTAAEKKENRESQNCYQRPASSPGFQCVILKAWEEGYTHTIHKYIRTWWNIPLSCSPWALTNSSLATTAAAAPSEVGLHWSFCAEREHEWCYDWHSIACSLVPS